MSPTKPKRTAPHQTVGYRRVSSLDQSTDRQLADVADTLDRVFEDKASGKDTDRPALTAMLKHVREGDTVVVHSMDRLARNLADLEGIVKDLNGRGVTVRFLKPHQEFAPNPDGQDPMKTLMLQLLGAVAQFERALIRERQREGIALAKAKGMYKGRKPVLDLSGIAKVREMSAKGTKATVIAKTLGISRTTLYKYLGTQPR
jgi:DNA invertase Pin-like site-specific DNA recombinase